MYQHANKRTLLSGYCYLPDEQRGVKMGDIPKRSDARARREIILAAAEDVFAELGLDAPLGLICERSGVGRATLYRNFASREALAIALFERDLQALHALVTAETGRQGVLRHFLEALSVGLVKTGRLFQEVSERHAVPIGIQQQFRRTLTSVHAIAEARGEVRAGVTVEDIRIAVDMMIGGVGVPDYAQRQARRERVLEICLGGLLALE